MVQVCSVHNNVLTHLCLLSMDLDSLGLEMVEIINKITPNEDELKKFNQFAKEKKKPSSLAENDRFLYEVSTSCYIITYVHTFIPNALF